jgi:signal transduction histidine kinase
VRPTTMVAMEIAHETERVVVAAKRMLSGRDGRIVLSVVLAATAAIEASIYTPEQSDFVFEGGGGDASGAVLLNVLAVLPLLATARFPFLAAAGASLVSVVILGSSQTTVTLSALAVLLYAVGQLVARRGPLLALPLLLPFFIHAIAPLDGSSVDLATIGPFLLVVAAVLAGESSRKRIEAVTALDATQAAMAESAREQTAMEERAAIARELHDIVAHSVTVMLLGVRGAHDVLRTQPAAAEAALAQVEASGERSLAELRRMLGLLRGEAPMRPQPSLAELGDLVAEHRAAGLPVRLEITGATRPLPGGVELSAYRIVQEALTNAVKHGRPSRVVVTVAFRGSRLDIEVVDDGGAGWGLAGMRERVALLGGELETGRAAGGYRVAARLPV